MASPDAKITKRDLDLLSFTAEHRLVLAAHVQALLDISPAAAYRRLRALSRTGFLEHQVVFHGQPGCYRISRKGLAVVGSSLPRPRIDLSCYRHDVGAAWLWLLARSGTFGPMREVLSERRLRSRDGSPERTAEPLGVRLGGRDARGRERVHYPDLLLVTAQGQRLAVELELTGKGRSRREKILMGYGADARIDAVLYLVETASLARAIEASAARVGLADRVHVQRFRRGSQAARSGAELAAGRVPVRRHAEVVR